MSLHAAGTIKEIEPNPSQVEFLTSWERFLAFFGGVGNGKTTIACLKIIEICKTFPNSRGVIARKIWATLESTTMEEFFTLCPPDLLDVKGTRRSPPTAQAKFRNGSTVLFCHLDTKGKKDLAYQRLSNLNLNFVFIDQAEEVEEKWLNHFRTRLRRIVKDKKGRICPAQLMLTGNMAGKNWIYRNFKKVQKLNHKLIEATTLENEKNLPPEYVADLLTAPKEWVDRYVYGSWDDFEGLIFDVRRQIHEIEAFEIPPSWERYRIIDHGLTNPTAAMWFAVDPDGNCYLYQTYYKTGLIRFHVENIMARSMADIGNGYVKTIFDPAVMHKTNQDEERGKYSDYDDYISHGQAFINKFPEYESVGLWGYPGNNNIKAGINMVNDYLFIDPEHIHPITHELGSPRFFIFNNIEDDWWDEQGDYTYLDESSVDEAMNVVHKEKPDPTKPDHLMDNTRYFFSDRPKIAALEAIKKEAVRRDAYDSGWREIDQRTESFMTA